MDRDALGEFLRHRREQLQPSDVGMLSGGRRPAAGLHHEEVAVLADMSSDSYERIEQGSGPRPTREMLGAIARALRLTLDERDHVYLLAGHEPPARHESLGYADPGLMCLLDALAPAVPALICDDLQEVVAQNPLNVALLGPISTALGRQRNFLWRWFTDQELRGRYRPDQHASLGREYAADLRASYGRRRGDAAVRSLVADLADASEEFRGIWALEEGAVRRSTRKVINHPEAGRLDLQCDVVLSQPSHQRLVLFRPQPGTGTAERLDMLRVGTESFAEPPMP